MNELDTVAGAGIFRRRDALATGYSDRDLARSTASGVLHRLHHGCYIPTDIWESADPLRRHRLRALALTLTHPEAPVATHTTAAAFHGLRLWKPDLRWVHLSTSRQLGGRRTDAIVYHQSPIEADEVMEIGDMRVIAPARAGLEAASLMPVEQGLCVVDGLLDDGLATIEELHALHARMNRWPGMRKLHAVLFYARRGSQSVGETRSRFLFARYGLPEPQLQYPIADETGEPFAWSDFGWPEHGVLGEFDGRVKYRPDGSTQGDASDVVFNEKRREDRIREVTGFRVVRLVWSDLERPGATIGRLRAMLRRAA